MRFPANLQASVHVLIKPRAFIQPTAVCAGVRMRGDIGCVQTAN